MDAWLEDHREELNGLMHDLEEKREQVKLYSKLLLELEKQKMQRILVNRSERLEKEISRLRLAVSQRRETHGKLQLYNENLRQTLAAEKAEYESMLRQTPEVIDLLDQDFDANGERYWRLVELKEKLQRQLAALRETSQM